MDPKESALTVIENLNNAKYATVWIKMTQEVKKNLSPEKLEQIWKSIVTQCGEYQSSEVISHDEKKLNGKEQNLVFNIVLCKIIFKNKSMQARISFNGNKIAGLFFTDDFPVGAQYKLPEYVNRETLAAEKIIIGKGSEWQLPGEIAYPKLKTENQKYPTVILVHGSGANDQDETIGPNKPFLDLTFGLTASGFAVIRYYKRTLMYNQKIAQTREDLTVQEEVIDDLINAIKFASTHKVVDTNNIIILGHSLGGYLLPRIYNNIIKAQEDVEENEDPFKLAKIRGLVLFAATARPLEDLVLEQFQYILGLKPSSKNDLILENLKKQVENVKNLDENSELKFSELPLSLPKKYWLDLDKYDPCAILEKILEKTNNELSVLVLQGGRDYQATEDDFNLWKQVISNFKNEKNIVKFYEKLNHDFGEGEGKAVPEEYLTEHKSVHISVIQDIAEWINSIQN
eukprot:Anaeramoba_flamelloidesa810093_96.p1 GENE.a810093_96~~a810093_96.p1  ORF type:complete len:457 (+),score=108.09 a810093_96:26-1396(+)